MTCMWLNYYLISSMANWYWMTMLVPYSIFIFSSSSFWINLRTSCGTNLYGRAISSLWSRERDDIEIENVNNTTNYRDYNKSFYIFFMFMSIDSFILVYDSCWTCGNQNDIFLRHTRHIKLKQVDFISFHFILVLI